jgi:G:T-mismatch repair DNA endonuclease (very short patch repair protein)
MNYIARRTKSLKNKSKECFGCGKVFEYRPAYEYDYCPTCRKASSPNEYSELMRQHREDSLNDPSFQKAYRESLKKKPNKKEVWLLQYLTEKWEEYGWKYVGDFSLWIGGKNPDFISTKKALCVVEMFGDYWHKGENPEMKITHYLGFGYPCLVVWEYELRDTPFLSEKISTFLRGIPDGLEVRS